MFNRISKVIVALILTVALVTEPVAMALAVETNNPVIGVSAESIDENLDDTEDNIEEDTEEVIQLSATEIEEIKVENSKDIVISWKGISEGTAVYLEKSLTGEDGSWMQLGEPMIELSYTDNDTEYDKVYYYRLKTVDMADADNYVYSSVESISTEKEPIGIVDITSVTLAKKKEITLKWTENSKYVFSLERSVTGESGSWKTIASNIEGGIYTDKNTELGKKYYYRLKIGRTAEDTDVVYSNVVSKTTNQLQLNAPVLNRPSFATNTSVKLTWSNIKDATGYKVWKKTGSDGSWKSIATVKKSTGSTTTYINKSVSTTKWIYYKIQPVKSNTNTNTIYSEVKKCHTPFKAVSVRKPVASPGKIVVKWSKVNFAKEYRVYRKKSGGNWVRKKTVKAGNTLAYTDKNVGSRIKYYYKVIPKSDYAMGTKYKSVYVYSRLFKPVVKVNSRGKNFVSLKWSKVKNANVYRVYKSTDRENWVKVKETKSLKYKVSNLATKKKYYFKVRAYCRKNGKNLDYRDSSSIKTATRFSGTSQVIVWRGTSTATIKWASVSGAEKYLVYMSSDNGKSYKKIYEGTSRDITKSNVSQKKTYRFKVYAVDYVGGVKTNSMAHIERSLAPKYNNFQMLNLDSAKFLKMMKKRSTTNYYLGTPYGSIKDDPNITVTEAGFTRPNGMKTNKKRRMNCAGFIGSIFRDAGADLTVVRQMGYSNGTVNACNWVSFFHYSDVKKYSYRSVRSLLESGRAEKGDIICRVPDKFDKEKNHDYHMMVFWGSNGHQNKMWHSTIQWGQSCNQISALPEQSYACTYYLVKLER